MITEYTDICALCGAPKDETHHMIFGRGLRPIADRDELLLPLCRKCHKEIHMNGTAGTLSKMLGQMQWETEHPEQGRKGFMEVYGRSYL